MTKITFEDYIKNPTGSRSRLVGEKDIAQQVYNNKYNNMLLRCAGNINYLLFKEKAPSKDNTRFVIYIQMPSESTEKLYYDVAIEFTADDDVKRRINKLDGYYVRFFSNDPNFIYTYAYAFNKADLIIPELLPKISKKALTEPPKITNPNELAGYVKSFYFAYLMMRNKGLFNKLMWINAASIPEMRTFFNRYIMESDKKILYSQHYIQLMKAKQRGDTVRVPKDVKSLEASAKAATTKVQMIRKVQKVDREVSNKFVKKIKPIGR